MHLTLFLALLIHLDAATVNLAGTGKPGDSGDGGLGSQALVNEPFDVVSDKSGNLIFSDTGNHRIRRVEAKNGTIVTLAGTGAEGFSGDGGPANMALLDEPYGLAIDAAGTIYFADRLNTRIRKIDASSGVISTVAGNGSKHHSGDGGQAVSAGMVEPNGVALDGHGRLFIADVAGHRVRVVDLATGLISTFAGDGKPRHTGDGGPARLASIHGARAVKVGQDGTVWIVERDGNTLRSVDPKSGIITRRAGTGKRGHDGDGEPALSATLNGPKELCIDKIGNVLIVDTENNAIRRLNVSDGRIYNVVNDGQPGGAARLKRPHGVAIDPDGSVIVGDTGHHRVVKVVVP